MTRYPRQVDREYLSRRSGGLNKIQMIDGCTPDLDQDLIACNPRCRYIVEHQRPTVFQQSDGFHENSPFFTESNLMFRLKALGSALDLLKAEPASRVGSMRSAEASSNPASSPKTRSCGN